MWETEGYEIVFGLKMYKKCYISAHSQTHNYGPGFLAEGTVTVETKAIAKYNMFSIYKSVSGLC